jgi:hypothetical protein
MKTTPKRQYLQYSENRSKTRALYTAEEIFDIFNKCFDRNTQGILDKMSNVKSRIDRITKTKTKTKSEETILVKKINIQCLKRYRYI